MLKTVFKNKETDQIMMITDSLACSWMPDGLSLIHISWMRPSVRE